MTTTTVGREARRAESSKPAEWGARAGFVARGVLWLTVGLLALGIALGDGSGKHADKNGALSALREQPLGGALLVALAAAFAAHAVFRVLEGTVGRREEDDRRKRLLKRAWSLCRAAAYGFLAVTTVRFLVSGGGTSDARRPTARVMGMTGGRWLVGAVGAGLVVTGVVLLVRGVRQDFTDKLAMPHGRLRSVVETAGTVGLCGRGLVYSLVGFFLARAAWTFDPGKAKGLDEALKTLAAQPFGEALLLVTVVGMLAYALWSFLEARYRRI